MDMLICYVVFELFRLTMILDRIENAERYFSLHPRFRQSFEFLRRKDLPTVPDGRLEIDGERLWVNMAHWKGEGREGAQARVEAHKKHIDIHFPISGPEDIGFRTGRCKQISKPYDSVKDMEFFTDPVDEWLLLPVGWFAIFFPTEAHAPEAVHGELHKATVKILTD